jgi:hypothetical protein
MQPPMPQCIWMWDSCVPVAADVCVLFVCVYALCVCEVQYCRQEHVGVRLLGYQTQHVSTPLKPHSTPGGL